MCARTTTKRKEKLQIPFTDYDYKIVAISSQLKVPQMLWSLNNALKTNFIRCVNKDFEGCNIFVDRKTYFPALLALIARSEIDPKRAKLLGKIDFVIEITGQVDQAKVEQLIRTIKAISGVLAVGEIQPQKIKQKFPIYLE